MATVYDELGLNKAEVEKDAGSQSVGSLPDPGVYTVGVEQAYIRKTDSGAKMFALQLVLEDGRKLFWETCTHAGDEKGNKPTFGVNDMTHFFQACHLDNPSVQIGPVKHKTDTIEAMGIPEAAGKKITIGFKHEENEYQGSVGLRGKISAFLDADGKNSDGEDLTEKLAQNIEKSPVKKLKASATAATAPTTGAAVAAAAQSGW